MNSSDDEGGEPKEKKIKSKSAAKKIVKNPQAKLDDMRLCGQRGLPLLPKTFRDVKFKGKGVAIIWEQGIFEGDRYTGLLPCEIAGLPTPSLVC